MSIFKRLLRRSGAPAAAPEFRAPLQPESRMCVIGDVHGCAMLLDRLMEKVESRDDLEEIIFVGDYVDRGDDSRGVIDRLVERDRDARVTCLMGNHEDMMLTFLDDPAGSGRRWLRFGGLQTLASFGITGVAEAAPDDEMTAVGEAFREALGSERNDWLRNRPVQHRNGNVAVVHAGAAPALPMEAQNPGHLIWGHPTFGRTPRSDGVWVVHGHTIVSAIEPHEGVIGVDTGAYATGRLSGVILSPDGGLEVVEAVE
ncbi:MAG: metallophosphoesterase family protein [Maritimibacter harenae]